ncbi:MAG: AIPR family protein [Saprospiraceae bacterium]|nr:AIPR family protein [Saprospiraceae bacterium]
MESNVRAFLQQTGKINKGIRDTIREEPYMFLPYNNGLATTAQQVKTQMEDGRLVITSVKDFQIVNGGQTTASLFHTGKKYKADLSQVFVQMKLTVIKDEEKKNKTVPYISRYANSQNKVSELDLTSNNPFLQKLEELSRTTYAIDPEDSNKQTIWFFERVKGQYRETLNKEPTKGKQEAFKLKFPRNQVIVKSEIAKYMNIWNQQPFHVAKGAQKNYNQFLKEVEKDFKNKKPGRVYWQDIVSNAILFQTADKLFGRKNQDPIGDTNIKSQTVAYVLSYLHFITRNRLNLALIWDKQMIPEDIQSELKKELKYVYDFLNNLDAALISEAAKAEKTWTALKEQKEHPLNMVGIKRYLISDVEFKNRYDSDNTDTEEVLKYNNLQKNYFSWYPVLGWLIPIQP